MRINFRQGLIAFQKSASLPVFLQPSGTPDFIAHIVSPTSTFAAFAHGSTDYLQVFDNTVDLAWGPITSLQTSYLYWDIDLLTANVSRGITLLAPITAIIAPTDPANDQHWFDLSTTMTKVWSTGKNAWQSKVRLFAGSVLNGSISQIQMFEEGSQVGLSSLSNPGFIVRDTLLMPLRKSNGEFLIDDESVRINSTVGTAGVLIQPVNRIIPVRAGESIPRMSLVYFSDDDIIKLASSNPALSPSHIPVGIVMDALVAGDVGTLSAFGEITFDQWDWSGSAGLALYIDFFGQLTLVRPQGLLAYRVGFVKNKNTILLGIDAETYPQVYQAAANSVIIAGVTPVFITDSINGIGERIVTVAVPNVTSTHPGLMTPPQALAVESYNNRIIAVETDAQTLFNVKANNVHTHVIADVLDLTPALDLISSNITLKADKIIAGTVDNFISISSTGDLKDSGYTALSFAAIGHVHSVPDISGLQVLLNNKSNRFHLNAFSEIFLTVDRSTSVDLGTGGTLIDALALKSNINHVHSISSITGLQAELDGKAFAVHTHVISDITGLQFALSGKASVSHTHIISDVTGLQAALDTLTSDLALKSVIGHTHVISEITGLSSKLSTLDAMLAGKSDNGHMHIIADVTGLQAALDTLTSDLALKAALGHTHVISEVTDLQAALDTLTSDLALKSVIGHTHVISEVTDLQAALDTLTSDLALKSVIGHTHVISEVTDLQAALDTLTSDLALKAALGHTHVSTDITDFTSSVKSEIKNTLIAGANITLGYNESTGAITITAASSGTGSTISILNDLTDVDTANETDNSTLIFNSSRLQWESIPSARVRVQNI
jgi:hypothetical protein